MCLTARELHLGEHPTEGAGSVRIEKQQQGRNARHAPLASAAFAGRNAARKRFESSAQVLRHESQDEDGHDGRPGADVEEPRAEDGEDRGYEKIENEPLVDERVQNTRRPVEQSASPSETGVSSGRSDDDRRGAMADRRVSLATNCRTRAASTPVRRSNAGSRRFDAL